MSVFCGNSPTCTVYNNNDVRLDYKAWAAKEACLFHSCEILRE